MSVHLDVRRHSELFDPYTFTTPIHVIGVGATGSWLVLQLAKLGIDGNLINAWDFDTVEAHNIPNQAYANWHIGEPKVKALHGFVLNNTSTHIKVHNEKYENQRLSGIVFLMVDSMSERKRIWEQSIKMKSAVKLLIEPRMGLDVARVYNVNPTDIEQVEKYEACFYSDEEAEVSACGTSLTVITSAMVTASWCTRQLLNFHQNEETLDNEILIDYKFNNIVATRWS